MIYVRIANCIKTHDFIQCNHSMFWDSDEQIYCTAQVAIKQNDLSNAMAHPVPSDKQSVITAGSPSGIAATPSATAIFA